MKSLKLVSLFLAGALTFTLAGCNGAETSSQDPSTGSSQEASKTSLLLDGSTSVGPLAELLAENYTGGLEIKVQQTGSGTGIQSTLDGSCDIGMASRDLTAEEEAEGLVPTSIAIDGIAIIVNAENPVTGLTSEQITKIFSGEITNWSEVGGNDAEIIVVSREAGSGTRGAFEELLSLEQDGISLVDEAAEVFCASNGEVKQNIVSKPNAIGYLSLGLVDDTVRALDVDSVQATSENILAGTYPVARPFLFVTKGEPAGEVKEFIDYVLSAEGQELVASENYIRVDQ